MKTLLHTCALIPFLAATLVLGQAAAAPAFEVATVRPAAPLDMQKLAAQIRAGQMPRLGPHVEADRAEYIYMTLKSLIALAYQVKEYQVNGPARLESDRFDIVAKLPEGASKDDAPAMLQTLLVERFKLAVHRDTAEHKVLALLVGKDGPKLKESPPASTPVDENAPLKPGEMKMEGPDGPIRIRRNPDGSTTVNMGAKGTMTQRIDAQAQTVHIESSMVTMAGFADMLTNMMRMGGSGGQQVVDQTGLKGNFQVSVDLSLADLMAVARSQGMIPEGPRPASTAGSGSTEGATVPSASDPVGGVSIYQSVERLGLKLEKRQAVITQLIVDHVEKTPTEN